ncbi:hypothetical protein XELAEV_18030861mg [Xenopus laevis]|uniref:Uncharacterized protein n=1 Tax=Xenopus laevis TaxID=8355 RepID=A0A974HF54_XENLA|nr:hypothetical protein XELAEV_18030861mg [Xenopus laevis]
MTQQLADRRVNQGNPARFSLFGKPGRKYRPGQPLKIPGCQGQNQTVSRDEICDARIRWAAGVKQLDVNRCCGIFKQRYCTAACVKEIGIQRRKLSPKEEAISQQATKSPRIASCDLTQAKGEQKINWGEGDGKRRMGEKWRIINNATEPIGVRRVGDMEEDENPNKNTLN